MIVRSFKAVAWAAGVGGAALSCYMVSLNVAAERAELEAIQRKIVIAKQDIRSLQTELGTRGRMAQLDQWNAEVLALSAPSSGQFLESTVMLARFDQRPQTIEDRAKVQLASLETGAASSAKPQTAVAPGDYETAGTLAEKEPRPLVRRASLIVAEEKPLAQLKRASLIDEALVDEIGDAARSEKKKKTERGAGGQ